VIDLDEVTLAEIIRLNTGITNLQETVFFATTAGLPGDFNFDGIVNAADYTVWRDALGDSVSPFQGADATGDGLVTQADYSVWKSNFGASLSSVEAAGSQAVPEPTSAKLFAAMLLCAVGIRRRSPGLPFLPTWGKCKHLEPSTEIR
jgi:hypothetical protein